MAGDLSEEVLQKLFKRFDTNGDGKISPAELADGLQTCGIKSTDEIQLKLEAIDADGDGFISYDEVLTFAKGNPDLAKVVALAFKE